jgi:hypothetical protein
MAEVATFRFSSVADSYAGRLGQARDVGVIGVAFFPEREQLIAHQPPAPPYYPRPSRVAPAPRAASGYGGVDLAPASPAPAPATASADGVVQSAEASGPRAKRAPAEAQAEERRGLGTEFGESRESRVSTTDFERASARVPSQVVAIRYNDRAGLVALGIVIPTPHRYVDSEVGLRETATPFRETRFAQPPP